MKIAGLILMGGRNSRMGGRKKAFLHYKGKPFIDHAVWTLEGLDKIYLSVEQNAEDPAGEFPIIEDEYPGIGPMGGIYSGLKACEGAALLVVPCDMPTLPPERVQELLAAYRQQADPVFFQQAGRLNPLPGIYTQAFLPVFQQRIAEEHYRLSTAIRQLHHQMLPLEEPLENINTPEEYKRLTNRKK